MLNHYKKDIRAISIKALITLVIIAVCSTSIQGQETGSENEKLPAWVYDLTNTLTPYGSIRIGFGFAEEGEFGVANNAPRVGFRLKHALSENNDFSVIGRVEFGLNLTSRDETVEFAVDPGAGITQVGDAVFARLGYVGFSYKSIEFTFGKQNSVYYELGASHVDRTLAFGGAGLGVWNISDGGVSGTGRANQVVKLKYQKNGLSLGIQTQTRNVSTNSTSFDSYGLAAHYKINGLGIGLGYNKVNDGVDNPLPNQAKEGDEALIVSLSYEKDRFLITGSYADLNQHQKVTMNGNEVFYDATGIEVFLRYVFSEDEKWHVGAGYNSLRPGSGQGLMDFDNKFILTEIGYQFKKSSHVFGSIKVDQSNNFAGNRRNQSLFGLGVRYGF